MLKASIALIFIANALSLYYAIFWLPRDDTKTRSYIKVAPMGLLIIAGILGNIPALILAGLVACVLGDYYLSKEGEQSFLYGLGAFLLGHLFYIGFFAGHFASVNLTSDLALQTGLILLALIAVVLLRIWPFLKEMKLPVLIYAVTIGAMAFFAKLSEPGLFILSGIALFVISDVILANDKFTPLGNSFIRRAMPYAIWILYFLGQSLIVGGFVQAV